jgi:hypothetical protein
LVSHFVEALWVPWIEVEERTVLDKEKTP